MGTRGAASLCFLPVKSRSCKGKGCKSAVVIQITHGKPIKC